jgi:uncharacterized membrane protein YccC
VALPDPIPAATGPADVEPPPMSGLRGLTALAVGVVIVFALYFGKEVLLPITLAILLSFILSPLVTLLRRIYVPRVVAVVFSVALAIAILVGRWHFSCYSVRRYRRRSAEIPKHNRRENRWSAECHRWTDFTAHRAGANGA